MPRRASTLALLIALVACGGGDDSDDDNGGAGGSAGSAGVAGSTTGGSGGGGGAGESSGASGAGGAVEGGGGSGGTAAGQAGQAGQAGGGAAGGAGTGGSQDTGPQVDRSDPKLNELKVSPSVADPQADQFIADEYAYLDTRVAPVGKLVVLLGGSNNTPSDWLEMQKQLAGYGFHVVSPMYDNAYDIGGLCGKSNDPNCYGNARLEELEGIDHTPIITVSRPNSIEERVVKMLGYFQKQDPGGDWKYYLDGDLPRWSKVVITGISHGASTAGVVGKARATARVVMASGPLDIVDNKATPWQSSASKSAPDVFYGFSSTGDDQHPGHLISWTAMGMDAYGKVTSVDGASPPFGGTHELETSAKSGYPHISTYADSSSPKTASGGYVFDPVWRYLYGVGSAP